MCRDPFIDSDPRLDFSAHRQYRRGVPMFDVTRMVRSLLLLVALVTHAASQGALVISEFLASNDSGLRDEDGAFSDWIEIHNPDNVAVSLEGFSLTDNAADPRKWVFPSVTMEPGAYRVIFASGKNRRDPAGPLHTDFQLAAEGEYLALIAPNGGTVISAFAPSFPPQFTDDSFGLDPQAAPPSWSFFANPTPGAPNGTGTRAGPIIEPLNPHPTLVGSQSLTVTARLRPANAPVASVQLFYRRMFGNETALAMSDNGTGADVQAGDGIWTAVIPATAFAPGEMTRWRFLATDHENTVTREPPFRDPLDSPQYWGTVAQNTNLQSLLPVFHWFTTNVSRAGTTAGGRGSVFYGGELYDNVLFSLHGQSTAGFNKKSYNIDFNRPQRFQWSTNAPRVADIDLLSNWADKSKVRHVLAYEVMRMAGVAAHFAYTVRVQQNGAFLSTADLVEDADEIYLERAGLNPDGALYKVYSNLLNKDAGNTATAGVEKKTRRQENNSDLQALINGLDLTGQSLERYLYDNIDIPACVNMLAANSVIRNIDMHSKNWYIYRDTGRSGEWAILPWDLDLSHGRVWNQQNTYFDNALYTNDYVVNGASIRLVAHLFQNPRMRSMILRRIRSLSDEFLQPPPPAGTDENTMFYERRLNEQSALIDPPSIVPSDARLDFEKWGSWLQGGTTVRFTNSNVAVETMAEAIERWKKEYLPGRRRYIYETQIVGRGGEIPLPQNTIAATTNFTALVTSPAPVKAWVPTHGNLGLNWTGAAANEPFNTSTWLTGTTGVGYERGSGYGPLIGLNVDSAMQLNTTVYLRIEFNVAALADFNRLQLRMKYDDGFVAYLNGTWIASANAPTSPQWNSAATVSREANPAAFTVFEVSDKAGSLRPGRNILALHGLNDTLTSSDMILVPELHAGRFVPGSTLEPKITFGRIEASPASHNQDEEFIQLMNANPIAVDLSHWRLTGGVEHTFPGGTVIPANGSLYVTPHAGAFRSRTVSPKGGEGLFVQGGYQGHLSSLGESLLLLDPRGATNQIGTYPAQPSDAQRHLVISEILYHPRGDGSTEFIEFLNTSTTITLNLTGVRLTQGVDFDFTGSAITNLAPGARVLVVRNSIAFAAAYGTHLPVAGEFAGETVLRDAGERIKLEDAANDTIAEFAYSDDSPWPTEADAGYSLVLIAPETNPDPTVPSHWRASRKLGGNPGLPDLDRFPATPDGDSDGNGERDLIDYALGNDLGLTPIAPRFLSQRDLAGGPPELRFSHPRNPKAEGVQISIQVSLDLVHWQDGASHLDLVSRELQNDGREILIWRLKPSLNQGPQAYLRLQAAVR